MLKSYCKIVWRNLVRTNGYSTISIGGLAVGNAIAMLIALWIYDELSYNKFHKNHDSIAQVIRKESFNGEGSTSVSLQRPLEAEIVLNRITIFKTIA